MPNSFIGFLVVIGILFIFERIMKWIDNPVGWNLYIFPYDKTTKISDNISIRNIGIKGQYAIDIIISNNSVTVYNDGWIYSGPWKKHIKSEIKKYIKNFYISKENANKEQNETNRKLLNDWVESLDEHPNKI